MKNLQIEGVSHFLTEIQRLLFYLIFSVNGPITGFIRRVIQENTQANNDS